MPKNAVDGKVDFVSFAITTTKILPVFPAAYLLVAGLGSLSFSGNVPISNYEKYFYYILFGFPIISVVINYVSSMMAMFILILSYALAWVILISGGLYAGHSEAGIATGKYVAVLALFVADFALSAHLTKRKAIRNQ